MKRTHLHLWNESITHVDGVPVELTTTRARGRLQLPPLSRVTPLHLNLWTAVLPTDSLAMMWHLVRYNPTAIPDRNTVATSAVWSQMVHWKVHSQIGMAMAQVHDEALLPSIPMANIDLGTRNVPNFFGILAVGNIAGAKFHYVIGQIVYQVDLIQRVWGDDMYTWDEWDRANSEGLIAEDFE